MEKHRIETEVVNYIMNDEERKKTKITVELDIEDLKNICESKEANIIKCDGCKQDIETLIRCNLYCSNFEIKEQK